MFSFNFSDGNFLQFVTNFGFSIISNSEVVLGDFSFFTIDVFARRSFDVDVAPLLGFPLFLLEFSSRGI